MKTRKLVKSGHASLVMAVPKEWLERNSLKPGDNVYVDDKDDKLIISTSFKEPSLEKKEIVINVDGKTERAVVNEISTAYLDNFQHIIIRGRELTKFQKTIKSRIVKLVALELVEESSERIVARSFLNIQDAAPKLLLRRMDNIVRSMMIDVKNALKDSKLVQAITDRDEEINRLSFLMFKILKVAHTNKKVLTTLKMEDLDILRYWSLNLDLEKLGDRVKNIANVVPQIKPNHKKSFLALFSEIEKFHKTALTAFYESSIEKSDLVSVERYKLLANIQKYIKKNNDPVCSQIAINAFNMAAHINDISRVIRYLK